MTQNMLRAIKITLTSLISLLVVSFTVSTIYFYKKESILIQSKLEEALSQAVEVYVKKANVPFSYYHNSNRIIGSCEEKTIRMADTTFIYRRKVEEPPIEVFKGQQAYLLETGNLHAQDIQFLYDSLLHEQAIYTPTVIGIQSSVLVKTNEWSKDTTQIATNFRTSFTEQGSFNDIRVNVN